MSTPTDRMPIPGPSTHTATHNAPSAPAAPGSPTTGDVSAGHCRPFHPDDEAAVIDLWRRCGLLRPWNDPHKDIARKQAVQPELFLVIEDAGGALVASGMFGYDGHRGAVYYLSVDPDRQGEGWGRRLMAEGEARMMALGCPKLNLQVRIGNEAVLGFYEQIGYRPDETVPLGKRLIPD